MGFGSRGRYPEGEMGYGAGFGREKESAGVGREMGPLRIRFGWGAGVGSRGRGRLVGRLECGNEFRFEFRFGFEIVIGGSVYEVGSGIGGGWGPGGNAVSVIVSKIVGG